MLAKFYFTLFAVLLLACRGTAIEIAVPSYWDCSSTNSYDDLITDHAVVGIAEINPESGPESSTAVSDCASFVTGLTNAGIITAGYVDTAEGTVPIDTVKDNILEYVTNSAVNSIFLDDFEGACLTDSQTSTTTYDSYYSAIRTYAVGLGIEYIICNPGDWDIDSCFDDICDITVTFEGNSSDYVNSYSTSAGNGNPKKQWHIIYDETSATNMETVVNLAVTRGASYVYVTNEKLPNPYASLPSYWATEVSYVASL